MGLYGFMMVLWWFYDGFMMGLWWFMMVLYGFIWFYDGFMMGLWWVMIVLYGFMMGLWWVYDGFPVGGAITILKNMSSTMGRIIPYMKWKIKSKKWNHQPDRDSVSCSGADFMFDVVSKRVRSTYSESSTFLNGLNPHDLPWGWVFKIPSNTHSVIQSHLSTKKQHHVPNWRQATLALAPSVC